MAQFHILLLYFALSVIAKGHSSASSSLETLHKARSLCKSKNHKGAPSCVLTHEAVEGPYYISHPVIRGNITEDREGIPLLLNINIVDVNTCEPLPAVWVDIWHADAMGVYSGWAEHAEALTAPVDTEDDVLYASDAELELKKPKIKRGEPQDSTRFLRGVQETDQSGTAVFDTIFPGWYHGRCTHVHLRIHAGNVTTSPDGTLLNSGNTTHTGQLFFLDSLVETIAEHYQPYRTHAQQLWPRLNDEDGIFRDSDGETQLVRVEAANEADVLRFRGSVTVAVDPTADRKEPEIPHPPGPPGHHRPGHGPGDREPGKGRPHHGSPEERPPPPPGDGRKPPSKGHKRPPPPMDDGCPIPPPDGNYAPPPGHGHGPPPPPPPPPPPFDEYPPPPWDEDFPPPPPPQDDDFPPFPPHRHPCPHKPSHRRPARPLAWHGAVMAVFAGIVLAFIGWFWLMFVKESRADAARRIVRYRALPRFEEKAAVEKGGC